VEGARDIIAMAGAVAGGEEALAEAPTLLAYLEPTSPLRHSDAALRKVLFLAGKGLPFTYPTGASAGAVAPATQAGVLVQATAEVLPGLVLGQLKRPGSPFVWGASCSPLDMRSMVSPYTTPEEMLQDAAAAELAHRLYHVPAWSLAGAADSKVPDMQAAAEGAVSLAVAALAGANLVHDCGYLESGLSGSFETLLLSDETAGLCRRFMAGIDFSPEELALDVIRQVGPGGTYLSTEHTVRHFRGFWRPRWFDHETHDTWAAQGARPLEERLRETARQILAEHEVEPLPEPVLTRLDAITEG
jgi:trimethylamine--corrinoid protein Co-methyltransferase